MEKKNAVNLQLFMYVWSCDKDKQGRDDVGN